MVLSVATDIFDTNRHFKIIARGPDLLCGMARYGKGVRHRQQIMGVTSIDAAPAEMVGKPRRICVFNQSFEAFEVLPVKFVGRAEIDRYTVLDDPVLFENRVKHLERPASVHHEIRSEERRVGKECRSRWSP